MKAVHPKYGYAMTVAACLWLGLFPLLQGGTYATLTHDKWIAMLILTGVTFLCFCVDLAVRLLLRTRRAGGVLSSPAVPAGAEESSSALAVLGKAEPRRPEQGRAAPPGSFPVFSCPSSHPLDCPLLPVQRL